MASRKIFGMSPPIIPIVNQHGKHPKSDLFTNHMNKVEKSDGTIVNICNYCGRTYSLLQIRSIYKTYKEAASSG